MSAFWPSGLISENNPRVAKRKAERAKAKGQMLLLQTRIAG